MKKHLMNRKLGLFTLLASLILTVTLVGTGCAPPRKLYATYRLPSRKAIELAPGTTLQLPNPTVSVKGVADCKKETAIFNGYVKDRFTALIYKENWFGVADDQEVNKLRKGVAHHHGYSILHRPDPDAVEVILKGNVRIQRQTGKDKINVLLRTVPYRKVIEETKKDGSQIISTEPDPEKTISRLKPDLIPYEALSATGELNCTIRSGGSILYERTFRKTFSDKVGGKDPVGALPTPVEISAKLFNEPLTQIVKDISPHSETRPLVVNEKGDPTAVALMRASAFSEAMERLQQVTGEQEKFIEHKQEELEKKIREIQASSKSAESKDAEIEKARRSNDEDIQEAMRSFSPDFQNTAIGCEVSGNWNSALVYYEMACNADPENVKARESYDRLNGEINKIKKQEEDERKHF